VKPKKVAIIVSNIGRAIAFEWIIQSINRSKFELYFILLNPGPSHLAQYCRNSNVPVIEIKYRSKKDIPRSILKVRKYLKNNKIDVVHCNLVDAGLVGLFAARWAGIKNRIYSRHHADFHHAYFPRGVRYDRLINKWATKIIAVSQVVKDVLVNKEKVVENKIELVHHGFNLNYFKYVDNERINTIIKKYNFSAKQPVIGLISRYLELKGIQYVVPAFKEILAQYPGAVLVLANAKGSYKTNVQELLKVLPVDSFREIEFEDDSAALYKCFNVFIHVPTGTHLEAFGQTYVEAMAAGIPSVFTLSGVGNEILKNKTNCIVVPHKDSDAIKDAITTLLNDWSLRNAIISGGYETIFPKFELQNMVNSFERIYEY
jgi:glycosyltransferase involved in cell wall biosynthesis